MWACGRAFLSPPESLVPPPARRPRSRRARPARPPEQGGVPQCLSPGHQSIAICAVRQGRSGCGGAILFLPASRDMVETVENEAQLLAARGEAIGDLRRDRGEVV